MSRRVTAIPWLVNVECGHRRVPLDLHIEEYGTGRLPEKYERELEEFFGTTNKQRMINQCFQRDEVPVLCPGNVVEIVNKNTGDMTERVAAKGRKMKRKLVYGNIPKGKFGKDDGIVNVSLGKRYAAIAKTLFLAERVMHRVVSEQNDEQRSSSRSPVE